MPLQRGKDSGTVFRRLDWPTVLIYLIMVFAGMVSIYAASYDFDQASMFSADEFSGKQLRWIGLSLLLGMVILLVDARMYETYAYPVYFGILILLAITPFVAHDIKGSHSWISFGSMSLQPAEFAKFATALALAKLFSSYQFRLNAKAGNYAKALAIIFMPVVLILLQNETGSALTFMALFFVLYREGMSGLVLFAAVFAVVIFVVGIKYTETMVMGMPAGQFAVLVIVMIVTVGMAFFYGRRYVVARNLLFGYLALGVVLAAISITGIDIPALPFLLAAIGIACVYVCACMCVCICALMP